MRINIDNLRRRATNHLLSEVEVTEDPVLPVLIAAIPFGLEELGIVSLEQVVLIKGIHIFFSILFIKAPVSSALGKERVVLGVIDVGGD